MMRDRLVELLMNVPKPIVICVGRRQGKTYQTAQNIAEYLISNGVIVPPCKVGDTVYVIFSQFREEISECRIDEFSIRENGMWAVVDIIYPNFVAKRHTSIPFYWFGKFAFPTKEDAEQGFERLKR